MPKLLSQTSTVHETWPPDETGICSIYREAETGDTKAYEESKETVIVENVLYNK